MIKCCNNCTKRWIDIENMKRCHDYCDDYLNEKNNQKSKDYMYNDFKSESVERLRKHMHKKRMKCKIITL